MHKIAQNAFKVLHDVVKNMSKIIRFDPHIKPMDQSSRPHGFLDHLGWSGREYRPLV